MEASETTSCRIVVVEIILSGLKKVIKHLEKLGRASGILGKAVRQMMAEMESPVLEEFSTLEVAFEHCDLERVETLAIHALDDSDFLQVLDHFDVAIGCSVVQESVVTIIPFVVFLGVAEQIKESFILIISERNHQRRASVAIRFR